MNGFKSECAKIFISSLVIESKKLEIKDWIDLGSSILFYVPFIENFLSNNEFTYKFNNKKISEKSENMVNHYTQITHFETSMSYIVGQLILRDRLKQLYILNYSEIDSNGFIDKLEKLQKTDPNEKNIPKSPSYILGVIEAQKMINHFLFKNDQLLNNNNDENRQNNENKMIEYLQNLRGGNVNYDNISKNIKITKDKNDKGLNNEKK